MTSDTMEEVHAFAAEEDDDVVATTTRAGFMLGFGLGAAFEVGFNCGLEMPPLASATAGSATGVSARITLTAWS